MNAPAIFASHRSRRGRQILIIAVALLGVLVIVFAVRQPPEDGAPLDPNSSGRLGAKALVLLLKEGGADVAVSARPPRADHETAIVLRDTFGDDRRAAILSWVEAGGTLLVTDPGSDLTQAQVYFSPVNGGIQENELRGGCAELPALAGVNRLSLDAFVVFKPPADSTAKSCFRTDDGPFLVATDVGRGTVVAVGGAAVFTNDRLDEEDNAVLADAVLSPRGGEKVVVLSDYADDARPDEAIETDGPGELDLLPRGVRWAIAQLVVVFVIAALWRARRLGAPVAEAQLVHLPGSDLVVAVGELLRKGRHRRKAADALVQRTRRIVGERLGLPPNADPETLTRLAADRTGAPPEQIAKAVAPSTPASDEDVLEIAVEAERLIAAFAPVPSPSHVGVPSSGRIAATTGHSDTSSGDS